MRTTQRPFDIRARRGGRGNICEGVNQRIVDFSRWIADIWKWTGEVKFWFEFQFNMVLPAPLELCDAVEENGPHAAGSTDEVLVAQAAELMTVHIKVLERNVGGINLVHVHDLLQPLPHLVLTPELRLGVTRPQATCVPRHHHRNIRVGVIRAPGSGQLAVQGGGGRYAHIVAATL